MGHQVRVIWPLLELIASQIQYYFRHHVLQVNSSCLGFANVAFEGLLGFRFIEFRDLLGGIGVILSTFRSLLGHRKSSIQQTQNMEILHQDLPNLPNHELIPILIFEFLGDLTE